MESDLENSFLYERRVAFSDTDAMGVVHHANYLRFCEETRVAWMRDCGLTATHFPHNDKVLAVLHYQVWHYKTATFDDLLQVRMQVRRKGVRIHFQYAIFKNGERIADVETLHIPVDKELRPVRPDARLFAQLEKEKWIETWLLNS